MLITREVLTRMGATAANADHYIETLNAAMALHGIDTTPRITHFLAQLMHESGCLRLSVENLNYSVDGLLKVFPRYFRSRAEAEACARKPERIGNRVYGARMGNGPEASGDGYRYRGRGLIQLTGKDNYSRMAELTGLPLVDMPALAIEVEEGALIAAAWWQANGLNTLADAGDILAVSRRVNLGTVRTTRTPNGLQDRINRTRRAADALRVE